MQGQGSAQNALLKRIISVKTTNNESKLTYERSSKQNATHGVFIHLLQREKSNLCGELLLGFQSTLLRVEKKH